MRILVEIAHPKHVHFFRPLLKRWSVRGDTVQIVTRDKDITHALLDRYALPYVSLSRQQRSFSVGFELVQRWLRCADWLWRFRPDVAVSIAGITTALPSKLLRVPNLALTDTETAVLSNRISFPFADRILTPEWFNGRFGGRHQVYRGFHEWAYLHPDEFRPDPAIVRAEGIEPDEPYAVVRLVRWISAHDRGESGLSHEQAVSLVRGLAKSMHVYLSTEGSPPPELREFQSRFRVDRVHHVLAFAAMVVGESPSMATESALLGVPALLASSWAGRCGNMQVLEQRFGLMQVFAQGAPAVDAALNLAEHVPSRDQIRARREVLTRQLECVPEVVQRHMDALVGRNYLDAGKAAGD